MEIASGENIEIIDERHFTPRQLFPEEPHHSRQNVIVCFILLQ